MVTEVMGLLIVAGAVLLFGMRYLSRRKPLPLDEEQQEMRDATQRLKQDLEKTGAGIIERMEGHVNHLEQLIREAERSRGVLDSRIMELRELSSYAAQQSDAMRTLQSEITEARSLQHQLMEVSAHAVRQVQSSRTFSMEMPEQEDEQNFSKILQQSIERSEPVYQSTALPEEMRQDTAAVISEEEIKQSHLPADEMPVDETVSIPDENDSEEEVPEEAEEKAPPDSMKVRNLLLSGMSVSEVARETGMGRGAVELIKQMTERQLQRSTK